MSAVNSGGSLRFAHDDPPDVEQIVLGAILVDNSLLAAACPGLEPDHFAETLHRQIFGLMSDMIRQGREADPVTLRSALPSNVIIAPNGLTIPKYLARLAIEAPPNPPPDRIKRYASEITLLWQKRNLKARLDSIAVTGGPADFITALRETAAAIEASCSIASADADGFVAFWHGDVDPADSRPWLVYGTIAETGAGLLSGQWGTYKTFVAIDLACAIMSGTPIFDSEIDRRGGALLYAAEGESEVPIRLQASLEHRCPELLEAGKAPFAWLTPEKVSLNLLDPTSLKAFIVRAKAIGAEMMKRFGLPLALIEIDTVVATAGYKKSGDEQDAVLGVNLMKALKEISRETGAFVLGVDHFGKSAETGTRGTSAKEDNSDTVLITLGDKSITGVVTNPKCVVRKVKGGIGGREYVFKTEVTQTSTNTKDKNGRPVTTLKVIWSAESATAGADVGIKKDPWTKSLRLLRKILMSMLVECGKEIRPYHDGPPVRAVGKEIIRKEFYKEHPAEGDTPQKRQIAKNKAFNRSIKDAQAGGLIGFREIDDVEYVWLARTETPE